MSPETKRRRFSSSNGNSVSNTCSQNTDSDNSDNETFYPSNGVALSHKNMGYDVSVMPIQQVVQGASACLHDETLWRTFAKYGTEMIINRGGRYTYK